MAEVFFSAQAPTPGQRRSFRRVGGAQQRGARVGSCASSVHEAHRPQLVVHRVGFPGSDVHLDNAALAHAGLEHGQRLGVAQLANLRKQGGKRMA